MASRPCSCSRACPLGLRTRCSPAGWSARWRWRGPTCDRGAGARPRSASPCPRAGSTATSCTSYHAFHHLRFKGFEVFQAPYLAGAQLAHFMRQRLVDMVFGSSGLLLYSIPQVIIFMDWARCKFDWVSLEAVLFKWKLTMDQFIDICMLAGTEYCLTYPYLDHGGQSALNSRFNMEGAIQLIRQAPFINWMTGFPSDEMRVDHLNSYCICKLLVHSSPILHMREADVRPIDETHWHGHGRGHEMGGKGGRAGLVPHDMSAIMGDVLPEKLYFLLVYGIISFKLPQALAMGEWLDKTQPLVDTAEFRGLIMELQDYRQLALGLVAQHLNTCYMKKTITCKAFWEPLRPSTGERVMQPKKPKKTLRWRIRKEDVEAEMARQDVCRIDLKFCLRWHANEFANEGQLFQNLTKFGESQFTPDLLSLTTLVHFMLLEHLELIGDDGGITHLGNVLKDVKSALQEPVLVAMELMKFGVLTAEPFEPAQPDRPFSDQVGYPRMPIPSNIRSEFLLSRVMSLLPMRLKSHMWNADVVFDLAAFHCLVRVLKRTLRQMTEAVLSSILLKDFDQVGLLPPGFMCASRLRNDPANTPAVLPTFMVPRACMGIVALYFLSYNKSPQEFESDLIASFPCCQHPLADLKLAILFWEDLRRCVNEIAQPLGAEDLAGDVKAASEMLAGQQRRLHVFPDQEDLDAANGLPLKPSSQPPPGHPHPQQPQQQQQQRPQHQPQQARQQPMQREHHQQHHQQVAQQQHHQHARQHQQQTPQQQQQQQQQQPRGGQRGGGRPQHGGGGGGPQQHGGGHARDAHRGGHAREPRQGHAPHGGHGQQGHRAGDAGGGGHRQGGGGPQRGDGRG
ncbi:unnamed protein product [Prorocentrum cordatum]|uniref:E3 ubiquitin-protein ligase n=1 Tax=Prorocentrum cordatum TaxID=2364126 RepID=A0ABN9XHI7_9DINO|nr:unnamed protein product [Polarella glacialis]